MESSRRPVPVEAGEEPASVKAVRMGSAVVLGLGALAVSAAAGAFAGAAIFASTNPELAAEGGSTATLDSLTSRVLSAPLAVAIGVAALWAAGVRSRIVWFAAPVVAIAVFALVAEIALTAIVPDPDELAQLNEPLLAEIAPLRGAQSQAPRTVGVTVEFPFPLRFITKRIDVLPPKTTRRDTAVHYRSALLARGWRVRMFENRWPGGELSLHGLRGEASLRITMRRGPQGAWGARSRSRRGGMVRRAACLVLVRHRQRPKP